MTAIVPTPGANTKLQLSIASTFTDIAGIISINGNSNEVGTVETSTITSAAKTYRGTVVDAGEVSAQIMFDPAQTTQIALTSLITTPVESSWKLIASDTGAWTCAFNGILTKFELSGFDLEGNVVADISIKITGLPTYTP